MFISAMHGLTNSGLHFMIWSVDLVGLVFRVPSVPLAVDRSHNAEIC